jgi:uncharacterized oxidoreductase
LVTDLVGGMGASGEAVTIVADHLVGAHLAGHDSHGLIRLKQYRDHVREGKLRPGAAPGVLRETPATALLDGNLAWGQVVAKTAVDLAVAKARKHGVSAVSVRKCYHVGRVGVYPLAAAREGFIAQLFCNGHGVARVAPWGGRDPRLATNPIAMAVPTRRDPILLDITTSVVAEGKVRLAKNKREPVPEGWLLDRAGKPTSDPEELYQGGSLLPLGGREGHKGYALSVLVDLLGGILSGSGCGTMTQEVGNGLFLQVTDPGAFDERESFLRRVDDFVGYLKSSARKEGVEEILLPGEPELRAEARRRRDGIEIDATTWAQVEAMARELGVSPPA